MAITAAVGRIAATLVAMAQTRLELAAVEVQQEAQQLLACLAWLLLAALLVAGALLLAALFVILLFWDSYRLQAVAGMAGLFGVVGAAIVIKVRAGLATRPPLLSATLAELRNDMAFVTGANGPDES
jgi:uncharacterized membrane protein YqjE